MSSSVIDSYSQLKESANVLAHHYYTLGESLVSDTQYDAMFRELERLEAAHPELDRRDSPTQRVGGARLESLAVFTHRVPMLSLANAMDASEFADFAQRTAKTLGMNSDNVVYCVEPKYDGLSCSLIYENGFLVKAGTRGNGEEGEDVTEQVKTIRTVPLRIEPTHRIEVRGEVLMSKSVFKKLNEEREAKGEDLLANPRNAASGALRQLDPRETARRKLSFYAYDWVEGAPENNSHAARLDELVGLGFSVGECTLVRGVKKAQDYFNSLAARRASLDYEIDGIVFKVNDRDLHDALGWTSRTPNFAIAYKFPPEEAVTQLLSIDIQVGRTGALTPVARLVPVVVGGVTITNATLHNAQEIERKDLRVGDWVVVARAGDVIPSVVRSLPERRLGSETFFKMPDHCPCCGSKAHQPEGMAVLRCTGGLNCDAQRLNAISHYASRNALDIDTLGESRVQLLLEHGLIERASDLYTLTVEQLSKLPGMGAKSAQKLVDAIHGHRTPELRRFIYALGIESVGEGTSKRLSKHFPDITAFLATSAQELESITDIGPLTAQDIMAFLEHEASRQEVTKLLSFVSPVNERPIAPVASGLAGKTVVITGTLSLPRAHFERVVESMGGKVSGSVSKKTDYVLAGAEAGSKLDKANALGVTVLDEAAFNALVAV